MNEEEAKKCIAIAKEAIANQDFARVSITVNNYD